MKLTEQLTLHLNGGSKFSERHTEVLADGKPTGITIHRRTNGCPNYKFTSFEVHYGDEWLDVLTAPKGAMMQWIENRVARGLPSTHPANQAETPTKAGE